MRLNYTVLCIDDAIGSLRDTKRNLRRHNDTVGVETNFIDVEVKQGPREVDEAEFRTRIFSEIADRFKNKQIDLVMVDLHLGKIKGHEVIDHIRKTQTMYRPIVFYSGGEPEGEEQAKIQLEQGLQQNNLIGKSVFLSVRGDNLIKDLKGICSEMHCEEHKLNASRGLLMDCTSEIDAKTLEFLKNEKTWQAVSDDKRDALLKDLHGEIERQSRNADSKSKKMIALKEKSFEEVVAWVKDARPTDLDAMGWNKLLRALLKTDPDRKDQAEIHRHYFNDNEGRPSISKLRNEYAHQTAEQICDKHDTDRCKLIRDELRKHIRNIEQITKAS